MNTLVAEKPITIAEAVELCGGIASKYTVRSWIVRGILKNGRRIFLESIRIGGRVFTTPESLVRFQARLDQRPGETVMNSAPTINRKANRRMLDADGI